MSTFTQYPTAEYLFATGPAFQSPCSISPGQQSSPYQYFAHSDHATPLYQQTLPTNAFRYLQQPQKIGYEEIYQQQSKHKIATHQDRPLVDMEYLTPVGGEDSYGAGSGSVEMGPGTFRDGFQIPAYHVPDNEGLQRQMEGVNDGSTCSSSNGAETWLSPQQQQNYQQPPSHAESMTTTTTYLTSAPAQPFSPSQLTPVTHPYVTNPQSPLAGNLEAFLLRNESCIEIKRHLAILQDYFTHVLRLKFEDVAPAAQQAAKHWIRCAQHWELTVAPEWKAKLEKAPSHANPIQKMLHRQIRIHVMLETESRHDLGIGQQSSPTGMAWEEDVTITAFKKQLQLMKVWTRMFEAMLEDLKSKFPHFEDDLREYENSGGWDQILGDDGNVTIAGI